MKNRIYIHKGIAILLLLVFTVSTTPRKYLHDVFTKHSDCNFKYVDGGQQIATYQFSCGFVNLITTAPFIGTELTLYAQLAEFHIQALILVDRFINPYSFTCFEHRGPPIV